MTKQIYNKQVSLVLPPGEYQTLPHDVDFRRIRAKISRHDPLGNFTFWISLSLRLKTATKPLNSRLKYRVQIDQSYGAHHCSLTP